MTDRAVDDLNYGHFGQAVYDPNSQEWLFNRKPSGSAALGLRCLGAPTKIPDPSIGHDAHIAGPSRWQDSLPIRNFRPDSGPVRRLVRSDPDIQPALTLLAPLLRASNAVSASLIEDNPAQGELLAQGRIAYDYHGRPDPRVQVVALPGGPAGADLRILEIRKERRGWGDDRSIWLETADMKRGDTGWWIGDGAPILQISFAQLIEPRSAFLAVRFPMAVYIFRPLVRSKPTPPGNFRPGCRYPPSKIDANVIYKLPIEQTGGTAHSDVTFNPWYQWQFAVIDQKGCWSIFELKGITIGKSAYTISTCASGNNTIQETDNGQEDLFAPEEDGWGRILWVGDPNTIVTCNRRRISMWETKDKPRRRTCPDLSQSRSTDWILDIQRSHVRPDHFFVLTSTQLTWYRVLSSIEREENDSPPGAIRLMSWKHFRDGNDTTLRISLVDHESETLVLIKSQLNIMINCFRFGTHEDTPMSLSLADPTALTLPQDEDTLPDGKIAHLSISIEPVNLYESPREDLAPRVPGPGYTYQELGIQFYDLKTLRKDNSIQHTLLYAVPNSQVSVVPPNWVRKQVVQSSAHVLESDFIIDDGISAEIAETGGSFRTHLPFHSKHPFHSGRSYHRNDVMSRVTGGPNNSLVKTYLKMTFLGSEKNSHADEDATDFSGLMTKIADWLLDPDQPKDRRVGTLLEEFGFAGWADLDAASNQLSDLLQITAPAAETTEPQWELRQRLLLPPLNELDQIEYPLSSVYDHLINSWIGPLLVSVPGRTRLNLEKEARKVAAEICLGSIIATQQDRPQILPDSLEDLDAKPNLGEPSSSVSHGMNPFSSSLITSSQLPTPSATPSLISGSSFSTFSQSGAALNEGLKHFVDLDKHLPSLPNHMNRILAHWSPNVDPSTYDFETAYQSIKEGKDAEGGGPSPKTKAKMRRQAEKLLRRQRREAEKAKLSQSQSNSMPTLKITQRSSPAPMLQPFDSSSQVPASSQVTTMPFPHSQVLPGAFGGRPPPQKKRKTGQAGFR